MPTDCLPQPDSFPHCTPVGSSTHHHQDLPLHLHASHPVRKNVPTHPAIHRHHNLPQELSSVNATAPSLPTLRSPHHQGTPSPTIYNEDQARIAKTPHLRQEYTLPPMPTPPQLSSDASLFQHSPEFNFVNVNLTPKIHLIIRRVQNNGNINHLKCAHICRQANIFASSKIGLTI